MKKTRIISLTQFSPMMITRSRFQTTAFCGYKRIRIFSPAIFRIDPIMRMAVDQFKILFSIIRLIAIEMMDMFKSLQLSSEKFFHHQAMLINIAIFHPDQNVSGGIYGSTAFPVSDLISDLGFSGTRRRTKFSGFGPIRINQKSPGAGFTKYLDHKFNIYHSGIENQGERP